MSVNMIGMSKWNRIRELQEETSRGLALGKSREGMMRGFGE